MAHLYISAAHRSSGKTTVSIGLCRELRRRGLSVQPFKKGPDYIDPLWLGEATGRDCLNLDFHTMDREEIREGFTQALAGVEGGRGVGRQAVGGGGFSPPRGCGAGRQQRYPDENSQVAHRSGSAVSGGCTRAARQRGGLPGAERKETPVGIVSRFRENPYARPAAEDLFSCLPLRSRKV